MSGRSYPTPTNCKDLGYWKWFVKQLLHLGQQLKRGLVTIPKILTSSLIEILLGMFLFLGGPLFGFFETQYTLVQRILLYSLLIPGVILYSHGFYRRKDEDC